MSHKLAKLIKRNYQASKSASSKYLGRRLGDRPLLPSSIANVTTGTFAVLMLSLAMPALLTSSTTYAEPYALSISFVDSEGSDISSPTMELNVSPSKNGTFAKSSTSTIGVGTTSTNGYSISIAATSSDGDKLINASDDNSTTNHLSSIESALTEEQFKALGNTNYNNQWGYLPSKWNKQNNTSFLPAPSPDGDVLNQTSTSNPVLSSTATDVCKRYECDKYDITIGARVDSTQQIGTYSNTYVVYATTNGNPYTITYKDISAITNFPADDSGNAMGSVNISSQVPTRDGYTFLNKWCTVPPTTNSDGVDTCSGTEYTSGQAWTPSNSTSVSNLTLYAMWSGNYNISTPGTVTYMQDFATMSAEKKAKIISSMATGTAYTVTDSRADKATYKIAKLKDGNVWMLDNLRLGGDAEIALTPSDTNIDKGYNLPASTTTGYTTYTEAKINTTYKNTVADTHYGVGSGKIGVYYNYCAISAGTYCYAAGAAVDVADTIVDSPQDICPAGWRLPTGGTTGDFQNLYGYYAASGTAPSNANSLFVNLSLTLSGAYYENDRVYYNQEGWFPTSTYYNGNDMYRLLVHSSGRIGPAASYSRYYGWTVRCMMQ